MSRKPQWRIYAQQVRDQLDKMKPTRSGRRAADYLYRCWLTAQDKKNYPGNELDWQFLIGSLAQKVSEDILRR